MRAGVGLTMLAIAMAALAMLTAPALAAPATPAGNAPFCLKTATGQLSCSFASMSECDQARGGSDQCITRSDAHGTTGLGERPTAPSGAPAEPLPTPAER